MLPRFAAILRAVDAALRIRPVRVAERADIDEIGVRRVDAHLADVACLGQPTVLPRSPAIDGSVDTVSVRDIAADGGFAHTNVDHVRIGLRDGNGADGRTFEKSIRDVLPV